MKIHYGMNLLYAAKRWIQPDVWGQHIAERWRVEYAQFCFDLLDPRATLESRQEYALEVEKASKKYGFKMHSCLTGSGTFWYTLLMNPFPKGREDAWQWCELAAETSEILGAKGLGGPIAAASSSDYKNAERFGSLKKEFVKGMQFFAKSAAKHNQDYVLFEPSNLGREGLIRIAEAKGLYEALNKDTVIPIHFMLDVGHQCGYEVSGRDSDPYAWLEELGQLSPIVHIQQTNGKADCHWSFTKENNKKGIIRIEKVLNALGKSGLKEVVIFPEFFYGTDVLDERILDEIDESWDYLKEFQK
jgi:sugar phosphate isomerase/epimerase